MTDKHHNPEWYATTKVIKGQVTAAHARGEEVPCWRCGKPLPEDAHGRLVYDVGHINPHGGNGTDNAAPEHRHKTGTCIGNRAHGGRMGADKTNAKRNPNAFKAPTWA